MNEHAVKHWLAARAPHWEELEASTKRIRQSRWVSLEQMSEFVRLFRQVQGDLALARGELSDSRLAAQLESILIEANDELAKRATHPAQDLLTLLGVAVPRAVRKLWSRIAAIALWFSLSICIGWWLVTQYPELARLFLSDSMIRSVESGNLWTDAIFNVVPSSVVSFGIMTNNIMVVLSALALGVFYGIGTLYIVTINGILLGSTFAYTYSHGLGGELFEFVLPHGVLEISVILLTAAAGFSIGEALTQPGHVSRVESFRRAAGESMRVCAVAIPFLALAGLIEGHLSPRSDLSLSLRIGVAIGSEAVFLLVLSGVPFRRRGADS